MLLHLQIWTPLEPGTMESFGSGMDVGSGADITGNGTNFLSQRGFCSSGVYNLSCFDSGLDANGITAVRWKSSTPATATATAAILLVYMVLGIPCNLFVIVTILYKKLYKEPLYILLLNLVINDLILCLTFIPMNIVSGFAGEFIFGTSDIMRCHVCKVAVIVSVFINMTLHLLALITIDRFIYFQFPFHYSRLVTVKRTLLASFLTWIFCILISIPPLFKFGEVRFTHSLSTCFPYYLDRTDLTYNIFYEVFSLVEAFVLPIPILLVLNIGVVRLACKHINKIYSYRGSSGNTQVPSGGRKSLKNRKQFKLVQVYGAILIFHLISWLPIVVNTALIFAFCSRPFIIPHELFVFNYAFALLGVVMHPFLQACLIPDIRRVLTGCTCKTTLPKDLLESLPRSQASGRMSILRSLSTKSDVEPSRSREGAERSSSLCCPCAQKWSSKITGGSQLAAPHQLTNGSLPSSLQSSSQPSPTSFHRLSPLPTSADGHLPQPGGRLNSPLSSHPLQSSYSSHPPPSSGSLPVQRASSCSKSEDA